MTARGVPRPTTGRYSEHVPGLPGVDPRRADARLRDFSVPPPKKEKSP